MNKLIRSEDNEQLLSELGSLITVVEPNQMRKSAASNAMSRKMLADHKPDKDHFLVHVIAMGDFETYGFNRNADAFTKQANQDYHHTFVSDGHFFREHKNQDPKFSIGDIVASIHNEDMGRTELAVWGHKKKASDVRDKLHSGEPISVSMSCFVDHDVDSCTEKKAKTPMDYEPHMKHSPGQYIPQFQKYAFVFNPKPRFFDVSYVKKPADRIAHYLDYYLNEDGDMAKSAAAGGVIPGALLAKAANIVTPPSIAADALYKLGLRKASILKKAAAAEKLYRDHTTTEATGDLAEFIKQAAAYTFDPEYDLAEEDLNKLRELQPETMFYELNKRAAVLPYFSFLSYATNKPVKELRKDASAQLGRCYLPSVFEDMMEDCKIDDDTIFDGHKSAFMSRIDMANTDKVQSLMDEVSDKLTVEPEKAKSRTIRIRISMSRSPKSSEETKEETKEQEKKASAETVSTAKRFAQIYGLYKIAAIEQMQEQFNYTLDNQLLMRLCSQHNFNP